MTTFYDFFDIIYGQGEYNSKRNLVAIENGIPLISAKGIDQGIYGYFDIEPKYEHVISVPRTGTICHAFYQGEKCCIDNNCLIMIPKKELSIQEMIYFAMLVRKENYKYVYGRQVTPERLGDTIIPNLPQWINKIPTEVSINEKPFHKKKIKLSDRQWLSFTYDDERLFEIKKGQRIINKQMKEGDIPCIRPIDKNNGVFKYIDIVPNHSGNTITVNYNGSVGEAFYQEKPYFALDDVNILYPRFEMNVYIAMFLIGVIKLEKYRFNYGRKWHLERMKKSTIHLPTNQKGDPDWKFMEDYIKSLPYSGNL